MVHFAEIFRLDNWTLVLVGFLSFDLLAGSSSDEGEVIDRASIEWGTDAWEWRSVGSNLERGNVLSSPAICRGSGFAS